MRDLLQMRHPGNGTNSHIIEIDTSPAEKYPVTNSHCICKRVTGTKHHGVEEKYEKMICFLAADIM